MLLKPDTAQTAAPDVKAALGSVGTEAQTALPLAPLPVLLADFHSAVRECRVRGLTTIGFWWRDDDLIANSGALQRMSTLSQRLAISPLVAIIPGHASPRLVETLTDASPHLRFAQHGFEHVNHEAAGALPGEFCCSRAGAHGIRDIAEGRAIMLSMGLPRFLDIFVPPWNHLDGVFLPILRKLGFAGVSGYEGHSAFGPADARLSGLIEVNANVEVTQWGRPPEMLPLEQLLVRITALLRELPPLYGPSQQRGQERTSHDALIGILTHHRVMRDTEFDTLECLFKIVAEADGCRWIDPETVFV